MIESRSPQTLLFAKLQRNINEAFVFRTNREDWLATKKKKAAEKEMLNFIFTQAVVTNY